MLNLSFPRSELTKSCNLLSPGVWATDLLNRKQPDVILKRQKIRIIYFYHLFLLSVFSLYCYESEFDLITLNLHEYRDRKSDFFA